MGCAASSPTTGSTDLYDSPSTPKSFKNLSSTSDDSGLISKVIPSFEETKQTLESEEGQKSLPILTELEDGQISGKRQSPDASNTDDLIRKNQAITKIQKQARRKKARKAAHSQQQWKMFADLDVQDEAEMLHLAVFMQTLIDIVPAASTSHQGTSNSLMSDTPQKIEFSGGDGMSNPNSIFNFNNSQLNSRLLNAENSDSDIESDKSEGIKLHEVVVVTGTSGRSNRARSKSNVMEPEPEGSEYNITSSAITNGT